MKNYDLKIYLVGGLIRNKLWDLQSNDYDFCLVGKDAQIFCEDLGYPMVGKSFPVYFDEQTGAQFALAREEKLISNNKYDINTQSVDIQSDLQRRDFTINAMAYEIDWSINENNKFVFTEPDKNDILNGIENKRTIIPENTNAIKDLKEKNLNVVRYNTFIEDPLRILRGFRFIDKYNLSITYSTKQVFQEMIKNNCFDNMEPKRIYLELKKTLDEGDGSKFIDLINEFELSNVKEFNFINNKINSKKINFITKNIDNYSLASLYNFELKLALITKNIKADELVEKHSFNSFVAKKISLFQSFYNLFEDKNLKSCDISNVVNFITKYSLNKSLDLIDACCFYQLTNTENFELFNENLNFLNNCCEIINSIDFSNAKNEKNPSEYVKNLKITTIRKKI